MWPNPQETAELVTFTEEVLNGKLLFFCLYVIDEDLSPDELQQRRAQLFNQQQLEMSGLEKKHASERKNAQKNAVSDWELKYAQAKLELKEKHYKVRILEKILNKYFFYDLGIVKKLRFRC